jgi:sphinganine-1-phosphate aldolase
MEMLQTALSYTTEILPQVVPSLQLSESSTTSWSSLSTDLRSQPLECFILFEHVIFVWFIVTSLLDFLNMLMYDDVKSMVLRSFFSAVKKLPFMSGVIQRQKAGVLKEMDNMVSGDGKLSVTQVKFPEHGEDKNQLLERLRKIKDEEWEKVGSGRAFGGIYHGLKDHSDFLNSVYSLFSSSNALYPDLFPSVRKFEVELVQMACDMMDGDSDCCGAATSGGTESILMACKTMRQWGHKRGIKHPEIVLCDSAHPAFDKASHYFGIKLVRVPVRADYSMNVDVVSRRIGRNTVGVVGSAPGFPHGIIDDIPALAAIAKKAGILCHVDSCLGGFLVPFYKQLNFLSKKFDFSVDGVTSISADVHKYGYANKGCSLILYRNRELRKLQYYACTEWSGGMYCSPSISGSRSGAIIAQAWASLMVLGREGYMDSAKILAQSHRELLDGLHEMKEIEVLGEPDACIIAFRTRNIDVYQLADAIEKKGWEVTRLQKPKCIHIATHVRNAGKTEQYLADVAAAIEAVREDPTNFQGGLTPVYGMAASLPDRDIVSDLLIEFMDRLYTA